MSDPVQPHRRQPTRLPHPWGFQNLRMLEYLIANCVVDSALSIHRFNQLRTSFWWLITSKCLFFVFFWIPIRICWDSWICGSTFFLYFRKSSTIFFSNIHSFLDTVFFSLFFRSCCAELFSHVWLFVTPWTAARHASLSMGLSRQEYWSGLPHPPAGNLPNPGIEARSPTLKADSLSSKPPGKPFFWGFTQNVRLKVLTTDIGHFFPCVLNFFCVLVWIAPSSSRVILNSLLFNLPDNLSYLILFFKFLAFLHGSFCKLPYFCNYHLFVNVIYFLQ